MTGLTRLKTVLMESPVVTLVYYLAVIVGLAVLYVSGDVPASGFIYQAF